ncbi:MAG: hypothetical protein DRH20_07845 [Deltaproteobacteria bacterium]|nr:MAG: hypothetical protein DRH20_07845 [Deltaproteobacteria bacterium]
MTTNSLNRHEMNVSFSPKAGGRRSNGNRMSHGPMVFDIHLHTRNYSGCSSIEAEDLVRRAEELGLDGIALTDHGIRWPEDRVEALREACGVHDLVIIPGQEITCYNGSWKREGDFLVFGVKESLGSGLSARELINLVHEQGGVVIAAHPYKRSRRGDTYYGVGDGMADLDVDCIEALHPEHDDAAIQKVRAFAESRGGIPLTGGSDAHELSMVGACTTLFHAPVTCEQDFVDALRKGKVTPRWAK